MKTIQIYILSADNSLILVISATSIAQSAVKKNIAYADSAFSGTGF